MSAYLDYAQIGKLLQQMCDAGYPSPSEAFADKSGVGSATDPYSAAREWRHKLAVDISWAYTRHEMHPYLTSDAQARRRANKFSKVRRWAEQLRAALQDVDIAIFLSVRSEGADLGELGDMLDVLAGAARKQHDELVDLKLDVTAVASEAVSNATSWPASIWMTGQDQSAPPILVVYPTATTTFIASMAIAYKKAFGREATVQYDSNRKPTGPFIAFVSLSMALIRAQTKQSTPMTNSAAAIAQALTRWRGLSDNHSQ